MTDEVPRMVSPTFENLQDIDHLVHQLFAEHWQPLHAKQEERSSLDDKKLGQPGVYMLAFSPVSLAKTSVRADDVFYVGMSNSEGGVRSRLKQFKTAIEKGRGHSGGDRFFRDTCKGQAYSELPNNNQFYFVALTIRCKAKKASASPSDFRQMGHITCLEYYVIAYVRQLTGKPPILNRLGQSDLIQI